MKSRRRRFNRLILEALESRTLLSTFVVDRLTDTGDGSDLAGDLRYGITQATSGQDTITFGVTGTRAMTFAHEMTAVNNLMTPASR